MMLRRGRRRAFVAGAVIGGAVASSKADSHQQHAAPSAPAGYYPPQSGYPPPGCPPAPAGMQYYPPPTGATSAQPAPAEPAAPVNVNVTVVMPSAPKAAAPSSELAKDAMGWDTERLIKHLQSIGMPASVIASCEDAEATGEDFVTGTESDLHEDLKISKLQVRKIKRSLGVEAQS